jgi:hypothetical protein
VSLSRRQRISGANFESGKASVRLHIGHRGARPEGHTRDGAPSSRSRIGTRRRQTLKIGSQRKGRDGKESASALTTTHRNSRRNSHTQNKPRASASHPSGGVEPRTKYPSPIEPTSSDPANTYGFHTEAFSRPLHLSQQVPTIRKTGSLASDVRYLVAEPRPCMRDPLIESRDSDFSQQLAGFVESLTSTGGSPSRSFLRPLRP